MSELKEDSIREEYNFEVTIETIEDTVSLPLNGSFQVRHDGVLLNGKLYFWEHIFSVEIINRDFMKEESE